ncbi:hypothetical protein STENM327S_07356 [Streptomyces tendae]
MQPFALNYARPAVELEATTPYVDDSRQLNVLLDGGWPPATTRC